MKVIVMGLVKYTIQKLPKLPLTSDEKPEVMLVTLLLVQLVMQTLVIGQLERVYMVVLEMSAVEMEQEIEEAVDSVGGEFTPKIFMIREVPAVRPVTVLISTEIVVPEFVQ